MGMHAAMSTGRDYVTREELVETIRERFEAMSAEEAAGGSSGEGSGQGSGEVEPSRPRKGEGVRRGRAGHGPQLPPRGAADHVTDAPTPLGARHRKPADQGGVLRVLKRGSDSRGSGAMSGAGMSKTDPAGGGQAGPVCPAHLEPVVSGSSHP